MPDNLVQGGNTQSSVPQGTPATGGSVPTGTPATATADADALKKLELQNQKLQQDINQLKSSSQRRESELQKAAQQRERELQLELQKRAMAGMDDEQKKLYEHELALEQLQQLQEEMQQLRAEKQEMESRNNAYMFFRKSGVPDNALVQDQDLETLVQSGYSYLADRNAQLEALLSKQPQAPVSPTPPAAPHPNPLPSAPPVDLGSGQVSSGRPGWADIDREYAGKGGREQFYREYEQGLISSDRIPLKPEE